MRTLRESIEKVCSNARAGRLTSVVNRKVPAVGNLLPEATLTFSAESFDGDLDRALNVLGKYADAQAGRFERLDSKALEQELREVEQGVAGADRARQGSTGSFNLFYNYVAGHKRRQAEWDHKADEDVRVVVEKRRQGQERQAIEDEARRKSQAVNRRWQEEMDAHAMREVEAELAWCRQHSADAFMKEFVWTIAAGAVTSFAGGFAHSVGAGYADYLIRRQFPYLDTTGR